MRGSIKRSGNAWRGRVDLGVDKDGRRRVVSVTRPTKAEVEAELRRVLEEHRRGEHVDPSRLTFGQWLETWLAVVVEPNKRPRTAESYRSVVRHHLVPELGHLRLQALDAEDLEAYYAKKAGALSSTTLAQHAAVIHSALKSAQIRKKVPRNVADLVEYKPRRRRSLHHEAARNAWERHEARRFLAVAHKSGPQVAAFYTVALELGLRKGELAGLLWEDLGLERGTLRVMQQLVRPGNAAAEREPLFGPPKGGRIRTLDVSLDTCELLAAHKRHQAEIKIANRRAYHDRGLVFAKEGRGRESDRLGDPLQTNNLAEREFDELVKKAGVRRITLHGLRHTSATLALQAGVPLKVVSERLGHSRVEITMNVYAHVLPSSAKEAARTMGSILHE